MKVLKVLNNNVLISTNSNQREVVVMGRGIGFQMKVGMNIDDSKVEKVFILNSTNDSSLDTQYRELIENIPLDLLVAIEKMVELASSSLSGDLHPSIRIALADHIHFAIERLRVGQVVKNGLLWEIKHFYSEEYSIGLQALDILKEASGIDFPEDEAGYIALHLVNAQLNEDMSNTLNATNLIRDVIFIIKSHLDLELDENSVEFNRLATHLKFFTHRLMKNSTISDPDDSLFISIRDKYTESFSCVEKISDYIKQELSHEMSFEEMMFLTIHVERVRRRENKPLDNQ